MARLTRAAVRALGLVERVVEIDEASLAEGGSGAGAIHERNVVG
jgi:hypothetical protein